MEPAHRRLPLLLLLVCVFATLAAAKRRNQAQAQALKPTPTSAPTPPSADPRFVVDAPHRCPDGQSMYNNNCRTLRGPAPQG